MEVVTYPDLHQVRLQVRLSWDSSYGREQSISTLRLFAFSSSGQVTNGLSLIRCAKKASVMHVTHKLCLKNSSHPQSLCEVGRGEWELL